MLTEMESQADQYQIIQ